MLSEAARAFYQGATMPGSVIIRLIALPNPIGSRPARRTTAVVRPGFLVVGAVPLRRLPGRDQGLAGEVSTPAN
ncbi:hypothetical protein AB0D49_38070 [Streptomyces sp. NPDC048290]|uniref:hypothetical protein n=1 Tax=Streptomyces sp. NPDC048290 TaxID=3155811 RepID=UPI00342347B9